MNLEPKYHVLLIGVDAYTSRPLRGCVNDIDAVQKLLVVRAGISPDRITRLASPHPGDAHDTTVPEQPADLANIRAALARLGSAEVAPGDRVFVYYSGHGVRVPVFGPQTVFCESLVPVDFNAVPGQPRLLPDYEFNQLLAAITQRTRSVTLVLDCCHSAGAARDFAPAADVATRALVFPDDFGGQSAPLKLDGPPPAGAAVPAGVDDCLVVAACQSHELAQENGDGNGVRHGLLSRALLAELGTVPNAELRTVPWARVWQRVRAAVQGANPSQHPWLAGSFARIIFGGPPVNGDAGFPIKQTGSTYQIEAGTLAGVGSGAKLAVYGDRPPTFPRLGSPEDHAARVAPTLLTVTTADRATATAAPEGPPFAVPPGARARLVAPGATERIRCAVVPNDPRVAALLAKSPSLEMVGEAEAQVRLEKRDGGTWYLTDDVAGVVPGYLRAAQPAGSHNGEFPPLAVLADSELDRARDLLDVYARYSLPLRMAARCTDLPGQLRVQLLACQGTLPPESAETADLPEVRRHKALTYAVNSGESFCIHVHNASSELLRTFLVNCSETGEVELLGDQVVNPMSSKRFWLFSQIGKPFTPQVGAGGPYINRLVGIGTTRMDRDLNFLKSDITFASVLRSVSKGGLLGPAPEPVEKWTATEVLFGVDIPGGV